MEVYGNGFHFANKDEIDKKMNVNSSLFKNDESDSAVLNEFQTPIPNYGLLKCIRLQYADNSTFKANHGAGILFGSGGMGALINVDPFPDTRNVRVNVSTDNGASISWQEDLAFKSDIDALKTRISALEKQIGGVLSSLLNRLKSRIEVVA